MKYILATLILLISMPSIASSRYYYFFVIEKDAYQNIKQAADVESASVFYTECISSKASRVHINSCGNTFTLSGEYEIKYFYTFSGKSWCSITKNNEIIFHKELGNQQITSKGKYVCGYIMRTVSDTPSKQELN